MQFFNANIYRAGSCRCQRVAACRLPAAEGFAGEAGATLQTLTHSSSTAEKATSQQAALRSENFPSTSPESNYLVQKTQCAQNPSTKSPVTCTAGAPGQVASGTEGGPHRSANRKCVPVADSTYSLGVHCHHASLHAPGNLT